jgi:small subunit ribosomal protein S20
MPNIKSAKKRMRQNVKRTARNRIRREKLKKAVKSYRTTLGDAAKSAENVSQELSKATRAIDKAGVKGIIHPNTVNRKKSRLAKAANRREAAKKTA